MRSLRIKSLRLKNYMLYKKLYKRFDGKQIVAIIAMYVGDKMRSNKGGKSTLLEAILFVLFGESRAKPQKLLIHHGEKEMEAEIVLMDDEGKEYSIIRGINSRGNTVINFCGNEKKFEAQKEINNLLGLDSQEFLLTRFFKQNDIDQFMNLGSSAKTKYLMNFYKNDHWSEIYTRISYKYSNVKGQISNKKSNLEYVKGEKRNLKRLKLKLEDAKKSLTRLSDKHDKIRKEIERSDKNFVVLNQKIISEEEKLSNVLSQLKEIGSVNTSKLKRKIASKEQEIDRLKSKLTLKRKMRDVDFLKEELYKKKTQLETLEVRIKNMSESFTGICPLLEEPCDRVSVNPRSIDAKTREVEKLRRCVSNLESDLKVAKQNENAVKRIETASIKLKSLYECLESRKKNLSMQGRLEAEKKSHDARLKKLRKKMSGLGSSKFSSKDLVKAKNRLDKAQSRVFSFESRIKIEKKRREKVKELKRSILKLQEEEEDLKYLMFMFSKNGIPSQELENVFEEIQNETNYVLSKLYPSLEVLMSSTKDLTTLSDTCHTCGYEYPKSRKIKICPKCEETRLKRSKEELHITVLDNNNDSSFDMESGGGQCLISIAIRVALTRLSQQKNGKGLNVLFLDEPDRSFDEANKRNFVKLITNTLIKEFGFDQVFYITHDQSIKESMENVLLIKRHENHSSAKWVS